MEIEKEMVFESGGQGFAECHASTLAALPDGTFLAAWFGGSKEGAKDVSIWLARRGRDGVWGCPKMMPRVMDSPHWNPVLFAPGDGAVRLFFKAGDTFDNWMTWVAESRDGGTTWSRSRELVPGDKGGRGPVKNKPIVLSDGSWLAPASLEKGGVWSVFIDRSADGGRAWKASAPPELDRSVIVGQGVIQPALWESAPGVVHMLMRSSCGFICRSDYSDGGRTWSPIRKTDLPNNNSGIDLAKGLDGRLILVCNPVSKDWGPRSPLSIFSSGDNGESWIRIHDLEVGDGEFSYPAVIPVGKGFAGTYTWQRKRIEFWSSAR